MRAPRWAFLVAAIWWTGAVVDLQWIALSRGSVGLWLLGAAGAWTGAELWVNTLFNEPVEIEE